MDANGVGSIPFAGTGTAARTGSVGPDGRVDPSGRLPKPTLIVLELTMVGQYSADDPTVLFGVASVRVSGIRLEAELQSKALLSSA